MDEEMAESTCTEQPCLYWRSRAKELQTELEEFTEDSNQLEKELEITIKLKDDQLTDLRYRNQRQQHEIDNLQAKLKQSENESLQWEQRYKKEKAEAEVLRKHTRELEQKNDDLERAHRIVSESVTEFERMLNREYEKNVMLEVEYEMEKENSQIQLQRLMDEARDLKQELKIQQKQPGTVRSSDDDEDKDNKFKSDRRASASAAAGGEEKLSNDSEVEKAELERSASERRSSVKMDTEMTNGGVTNGIGSSSCLNGQATDAAPVNNKSSSTTTTGTTRSATMQRENSLKQMDRLKNGNSMTASSRSTALAIVADLLRRVNDCLQLDTKLVCVQCKALQCECPASVEKLSIRSLTENPTRATESSSRSECLSGESRAAAAAAPPQETDDRPAAAIRLASILGIRRAGGAASSGADCDSGSSSSGRSTQAISSAAAAATPRRGLLRHAESQENVTGSPAGNWFKDKYQMATNKLMSKNIDATLKELKRPKSMDDDLADDDGTTTTIHSTQSEKAKSPSLIC